MNDAVLTQRRDEVLLITLNRPEARNAINGAVASGLLDAVKAVFTVYGGSVAQTARPRLRAWGPCSAA